MKRLTKRNPLGQAYYPRCFQKPCFGDEYPSEKCRICDLERQISEKLCAYEDTGLDPETAKAFKDFEAFCIRKRLSFEDIIKIIEERQPPDETKACIFEEAETHRNVTVHVLRCKNCGHTEITWTSGRD